MDGDRELLAEQMQFFLHDGPELLLQIEQAIASEDGKQLELAAHRLKGLVSGYGAGRAAELAQKLEHAGRDRSFGSCRAWFGELGPRVKSLMEAMNRYLKEQELLS